MNQRPSIALFAAVCLFISGCGTFLPSSGPHDREVKDRLPTEIGIRVVDLSRPLVLNARQFAVRSASLADAFGMGEAPQLTVGAGDVLEVSVWEAPPAALFSPSIADARGLTPSTSRVSIIPEQTVSRNGTVSVPFAGTLSVLGRTPDQVEQEITRRLRGKANDPQVLVRVVRNPSNIVTVVGEVRTSARLPLSASGERLLDALAAAGGASQPVGKISIRLTRNVTDQGGRTTRVVTLPLETIITDPAQNILLQPGDVITALYQSNSFTVLGATAKNEEINFEAQGISLAQALARAGGLQDQRADASAVFLFRFEDPALVGATSAEPATVDGKVPVIYRVDLKNPASFFLAQDFPMRNRDVLYVANAPAAELQKFMNLLSSLVFPFNYFNNLN
jgi:polysaccharide biosynthesis/export protein